MRRSPVLRLAAPVVALLLLAGCTSGSDSDTAALEGGSAADGGGTSGRDTHPVRGVSHTPPRRRPADGGSRTTPRRSTDRLAA